MIVRSFLDSNVFVYADDTRFPKKQAIALYIFYEARRTGLGVISTQVLQEYFSVVTGKIKLSPDLALRRVKLMQHLGVVQIDPAMIVDAIGLYRIGQISWWDALIVRAAVAGGCVELLTEDLQPRRAIDGVLVVNPFV